MPTEELYDVPKPPKMDEDYYNDLAEQSFEYEGSEDFQDCEDDESDACEARDDSDVDPVEQERYFEQEAVKHRAEAVEYYDDELQLEMMLEYGGCSESDDDPGADTDEPESGSQRSTPERNVEGGRNTHESIDRDQTLRPHDPSKSASGAPAENIVPRHGNNSAGLEYYEPKTPQEYEQWCRDFGSMTDKEIRSLKVRKVELELDVDEGEEDLTKVLEMNTDELFFYAWMR